MTVEAVQRSETKAYKRWVSTKMPTGEISAPQSDGKGNNMDRLANDRVPCKIQHSHQSLIRVDRFQPFSSRQALDTVVRLRMDAEVQMTPAFNPCLSLTIDRLVQQEVAE